MSNDRKRRPLPQIEEDIPIDSGVGPTATTAPANTGEKASAVPDPAPLPVETEAKTGVIVSRPSPLFESPMGPQFQAALPENSKEEQRAHYERIARDAHAAHESVNQLADRYLTLSAGQSYREIRDSRLYEEGLGYRTFEEYVEHHLDISRMHVYRLIRGVNVYLALPEVLELSFRQKDILGRVKDPELIRAVWEKATAGGDTSPAALKRARDELAVELAPADKSEKAEPTSTVVTLPKARKALERFFTGEALKLIAASAKKPEDVEQIAAALETAAARLREAVSR